MSEEVKEAITALCGNRYFLAILEWQRLCENATLQATAYAGGIGSEETFRNLGAYHALREMNTAIVDTPDEYQKKHG
tara:strand:+ start:766 stop:996 length:231 start_codon:yes stop_codon:yes gene_type:complete